MPTSPDGRLHVLLLYETRPEIIPAHVPADAFMEFDTPETVDAIVSSLRSLGHVVTSLHSQENAAERLFGLRREIDVVFNCSAGFGTRFRELMPAALCEHLNLPYTGSDPMAQALSANKHATKLIAQRAGVRTPRWWLSDGPPSDDFAADASVVIKPNFEGTSIGIRGPIKVCDYAEVHRAMQEVVALYGQPAIVEEFVAGYEVTVPILGNPPVALPPLTLTPDGTPRASELIFDSVRKSDATTGISWICAPFGAAILDTLRSAARVVHEALGCRDLSRSDFRVTETGEVFFLELNATPQIGPGNSFMKSGASDTFAGLLQRILDVALSRYPHCRVGTR
ncbi:MAG: hypothetical protein M3Q69_00770 [Acidobacteriota bacterium]|nr:hypothetical protein [Acidobacteriota bacterium]